MITFRTQYLIFILFYCWKAGEGSYLNRTVRQTACASSQFRCPGGGCISRMDICNGLSQCSDHSDEAPSVCDCGRGGREGALANRGKGAHDAVAGSQPWHVGIYRVRHNNHHTLLCSGTLIYDDIVLTSASCVIDPDSHLTFSSASVRVSVGKLKRDYNLDEFSQQKRDVRNIVIRDRYEGDTKGYARNLAIIKLKQAIRRSNSLGPACIWTHKNIVTGSAQGTISGWGLQTSNNYATNLKEALVKLMDVGECVRRFYDPLYKRFLTNDKFCMTFDEGVALKDDDVGGPVTVVHDGRYYLIGVNSVQLDQSGFGIATKVSKHLDWIRTTVYQLKDTDSCLQGSHFNCNSDSHCIRMEMVCDGKRDCNDGSDEIPSLCQPVSTSDEGGKCEIPDSIEIFSPIKCRDPSGCTNKYWAPSNTKYQITCPNNRGFADPDAKSMTAVCTDGEWIPNLQQMRCLQLCPPQEFKTLELSCQYRGAPVKCTERMRPETVIRVKCKKQFKKENLVSYAEVTTCRTHGNLQHDISAQCIPVCGKPFDNERIQPLLSNAQEVKYAKYPWHAGLYKRDTNGDYEYKCGGTLIDTNKILTAGHCVWESTKNKATEPGNLSITLGKYYSNWNIKEDPEERFFVEKIIPGDHYNGATNRHSQDIAVLILTRDVKLSDHIMPACLDLNSTFGGIPAQQHGLVVGWGSLWGNNSGPSKVLREAYMKYVNLDDCRKKYGSNFQDYLQSDKFCVEYISGSGPQTGDSGGGYTFTHDGLHYIYGVVSIKLKSQDIFASFTNVLSHAQWLYKILHDY